MKKNIDPRTGRDTRYCLIRVMYDKGDITVFRDIFKFIPKTTVSHDAGYGVDRFTDLMDHLDQFPLHKLFEIATYCGLSEKEITDLVINERESKKNAQLKWPSG
jgi:hypothetical protein